jgi:hypothetical protein
MRKHLFSLACTAALACTTTVTVASDVSPGTTSKNPEHPAMEKQLVLTDTYSGIAATDSQVVSSNFTDISPAASTNAADDFTVTGDGWVIETVEVRGYYSSGSGPVPGPAQSVDVFILPKTGTLPTSTDLAGTAVFSAQGLPYLDMDDGDFRIPLPGSGATLIPGSYWLIVRANIAFLTEGQWNWLESTGSGDESTWFQNTNINGVMCWGFWDTRSNCLINSGRGDDLAFKLEGRQLTPAVLVDRTSLNTHESGTSDRFKVVLATQPSDDVTVPIGSGFSIDASEGSLSTNSLTFTPANWDIPQIVTVNPLDDAVADGNVQYTLDNGPSASADANYNGQNVANVSVTNADDESPGVFVSPISGIEVSEDGNTTASFQIRLNTNPGASVTIPLSLSESGLATLSANSVELTDTSPTTITVTGINNNVRTGDLDFTVITGEPTTTDIVYDSLNANDVADVRATLLDDEPPPGVSLVPATDNITAEDGSSVSFGISLRTAPTADVVVNVTSSDTSEGTVSPTSFTFTPANWNIGVPLNVTGVDDNLLDGDVDYGLQFTFQSTDPNYNGISVDDEPMINADNDVASVVITQGPPLETSEAGGTASFEVSLSHEPTADVRVDLASSNTNEGTISVLGLTKGVAAQASLFFTSANWDTPQTVLITGVDDDVDDGDIDYTVITGPTSSADGNFNGLDPADVNVTNLDNDIAGINIIQNPPLSTSEGAGSTFFQIVLNSEPTADVRVDLSSDDTSEGTVSVQGINRKGGSFDASLFFNAANWNTPQQVLITGVDDNLVDGDIAFNVITAPAVSSDSNYSGLDANDVAVTNLDNDLASINVQQTPPLVTTEAGGTASFSVSLSNPPSADVTVLLASNDTTEGSVSPASLTFTNGDWNVGQDVTITGVDDALLDGDVAYAITLSSSSADSNFNALSPADVAVTNSDNDTANIIVNNRSGDTTSESGDSETFDVVLSSQPTADVTIPLTSSDTTEGAVSPASLTFSSGNWDTPQTVQVSGVDDDVVDGDVSYTIAIEPASSADADFNGLDPADLSFSNADNDVASITVEGISVSEGNAGDTIITVVVRLNIAVEGGFSVSFTTQDGTATGGEDYTPVSGTLNFVGTAGETQTIEIVIAADDTSEPNESFNIVLGTPSNGDVSVDNSGGGIVIVNDDDPAVIPTLSTWMLILIALMLGGLGTLSLRLRQS